MFECISLNPTALLSPASVCAEVEYVMILQKISQAVPIQQTCNMLLIYLTQDRAAEDGVG